MRLVSLKCYKAEYGEKFVTLLNVERENANGGKY